MLDGHDTDWLEQGLEGEYEDTMGARDDSSDDIYREMHVIFYSSTSRVGNDMQSDVVDAGVVGNDGDDDDDNGGGGSATARFYFDGGRSFMPCCFTEYNYLHISTIIQKIKI